MKNSAKWCCFILAALYINFSSAEEKPKMTKLHIYSDIKYRYASTLVSSVMTNPAETAQEVNFYVQLPESAFITGFVMTIDEKDYAGYVDVKEKAKETYDEARRQNLAAAHVFTARDSNSFQVSINVEPSKNVVFNLTYEEFLERSLQKYLHVINVNAGQLVDDMKIVVNIEDTLPLQNVTVPEFKLSNEIEPKERNKLAVVEQTAPNKAKITWAPSIKEQKEDKEDGLDGQFQVSYDVDRSQSPQQILVDDGYFVHFFADDDLKPLKKHVIFILDISGSMSGKKLDQVKDAVTTIIKDLHPHDFFSIILFSDNAMVWDPTDSQVPTYSTLSYHGEPTYITPNERVVVSVNDENVNEALSFIRQLTALGGTNIISGLRLGVQTGVVGKKMFKTKNLENEPLIIFLTDGEPNVEMSDPTQIRSKTTEMNVDHIPIHSLGFGESVNMKFLIKLSLKNYAFARRIYVSSDAALQLQRYYQMVGSPTLKNVKFDYIPGQVETLETTFRTLTKGGELAVVGKMLGNEIDGSITAEKSIDPTLLSFPTPVIIIDHPPIWIPRPKNRTFGHLEKMWAYKTVKYQLAKNELSPNETLKNDTLALALKYSFVTPLTSLVVVKPNSESRVDPERAKPQTHGFPSGGAGFSAPPLYQLSTTPFRRPSHIMATSMGPPGSSGPVMATYGIQSLPPTWAASFPDSSENTMSKAPGPNPNQLSQYLFDIHQVTWLSGVASNGTAMEAPSFLKTNTIISLTSTVTGGNCIDGNQRNGTCHQFRLCILSQFLFDYQAYLPYKCEIDNTYLGVCCTE